MKDKLQKFIPFAKVDEIKRQVWGIVTAEIPDKDDEVCDYTGSKPFYQAVIAEMSKATNGGNFFPLRAMHGLTAAGKCIGFDFRDDDKEIYMGFEVVDDAEWKKVQKQVYTGFSQGGKMVSSEPDPIFKGCVRYVANPSECSLVDNPCLGASHFQYVKADGVVEIRKFKTSPALAEEYNRLGTLEQEIALLKTQIAIVKAKTKSVFGEELPSTAFAYVGKADDTKTWQLPIKLSTDALTKRVVRSTLGAFDHLAKSIPAADRPVALLKVVAAAKAFNLSVEVEKARVVNIQKYLQKQCRVYVNKQSRVAKTDIGHALSFIDTDLGRLQKGLCEVSRLADYVNGLSYLVYCCINEQEYEGDADSPLPEMLAGNVDSMLTTLLAMVQEESEELRAEIDRRVA
jgi:hypothetical protein